MWWEQHCLEQSRIIDRCATWRTNRLPLCIVTHVNTFLFSFGSFIYSFVDKRARRACECAMCYVRAFLSLLKVNPSRRDGKQFEFFISCPFISSFLFHSPNTQISNAYRFIGLLVWAVSVWSPVCPCFYKLCEHKIRKNENDATT